MIIKTYYIIVIDITQIIDSTLNPNMFFFFFFFKAHQTNLSELNWTSMEEMDQIGQNGQKQTELDQNDRTRPK